MKRSAQQIAFAGGSFLLTLVLLLAVWMFAFAPVPRAMPIATPSAPVVASPTSPIGVVQTAAPGQSNPPTGPAASRTPFMPWVSAAPPLRTPVPSTGPRPSTLPGQAAMYVVNGADYVSESVPDDADLSRHGDSVTLRTSIHSPDALWVTWRLDEAVLPATEQVHSVDVRICGDGSGDFWEVYGPDGGSPFEYEVEQPESDGCWHFIGAPGHDLSVVGGTMLDSEMTIEFIEFRVTFASSGGVTPTPTPAPLSTPLPLTTATPGI